MNIFMNLYDKVRVIKFFRTIDNNFDNDEKFGHRRFIHI